MSKYLYNGIELPALPEWDKTAYPYASIVFADLSENYMLIISTNPIIIKDKNDNIITFESACDFYDYRTITSDIEWQLENNGRGFYGINFGEPNLLIWSNHSIKKESNSTVYLEGSEPVPIEPEPDLTNIDLYRKINGKSTKLTLYKKLSGKLIPLDEHTKEVKT